MTHQMSLVDYIDENNKSCTLSKHIFYGIHINNKKIWVSILNFKIVSQLNLVVRIFVNFGITEIFFFYVHCLSFFFIFFLSDVSF